MGTHILLLCPTLTQTPCPRPATMKFFALAAAAAALSARAALAVPFKRDSDTPGKPAFIGTLADYSKEVPVGGSINISYNTADPSPDPSYPSAILNLDVGLQGPAPIVPSDLFQPYGVLELLRNATAGDSVGWINTTHPLPPNTITEEGQYFLIFTERQKEVYNPDEPVYRVQSYNVSVMVTDPDSSS